jgi:hypothetical protein
MPSTTRVGGIFKCPLLRVQVNGADARSPVSRVRLETDIASATVQRRICFSRLRTTSLAARLTMRSLFRSQTALTSDYYLPALFARRHRTARIGG